MLALMKNNYYKLVSSFKIYIIAIFLSGVVLIFLGDKGSYERFTMFVAFSITMGTIFKLELKGAKNFERQVLALPVRRKDIVKSIYIFQFVVSILVGLYIFIVGILHLWYTKDLSLRYLEVCLFLSLNASSMVLILTTIYQPLTYVFVGQYNYIAKFITLTLVYILLFWKLPSYFRYRYSHPKLWFCASAVAIVLMLGIYILSYFASKSIFENKNIENYSDI